LAGWPAQGPYAGVPTRTDVAGNTAARTVPVDLRVDTVAPAAPGAAAQALITYRRAPWGPAGGGPPQFRIDGIAGTTDPGNVALALSSAVEIGRATAGADGSFSITLDAVDRESVDLAFVDQAGNVSAGAAVAN